MNVIKQEYSTPKIVIMLYVYIKNKRSEQNTYYNKCGQLYTGNVDITEIQGESYKIPPHLKSVSNGASPHAAGCARKIALTLVFPPNVGRRTVAFQLLRKIMITFTVLLNCLLFLFYFNVCRDVTSLVIYDWII